MAIGNVGDTSDKLGSLSEKYESGGRGPGTVSTGVGDAGGVSYGTYQMTSKGRGRVTEFLKSEGDKWAEEFEGLSAGSAEFTAKWKEIAAREPEEFKDTQHEYIERTHFDPFVAKTQRDIGLDITQSSKTLQDVIWSTAVQHGANNSIVSTALKGKDVSKMSEEDIIKAIYSERGREDADGKLVYFKKNSEAVQKSVAQRFVNEQKVALARLKQESGKSLQLQHQSSQPLLKEGTRSESVRQLQQQLQRMGYKVGADGVFGPKTKTAVEQFQRDQGLKADGIIGKNTWSALSKVVSSTSILQIQRQTYTPQKTSSKSLEQPLVQEAIQKLLGR